MDTLTKELPQAHSILDEKLKVPKENNIALAEKIL